MNGQQWVAGQNRRHARRAIHFREARAPNRAKMPKHNRPQGRPKTRFEWNFRAWSLVRNLRAWPLNENYERGPWIKITSVVLLSLESILRAYSWLGLVDFSRDICPWKSYKRTFIWIISWFIHISEQRYSKKNLRAYSLLHFKVQQPHISRFSAYISRFAAHLVYSFPAEHILRLVHIFLSRDI